MATPVRTRRKNAFNLYKEAERLASFDEFPMLRPEVDPQLHLSRNEVDQPFHLLCEKDCVLLQLNGSSRLEFISGPVRYFDLIPGDFAYVPGGTAHRLKTVSPGAVLRYKALVPGSETVLFICEHCGKELGRNTWNATELPVQQGYQTACEQFNTNTEARRCGSCGTVHASIDLSVFRWSAIVEKLRGGDED